MHKSTYVEFNKIRFSILWFFCDLLWFFKNLIKIKKNRKTDATSPSNCSGRLCERFCESEETGQTILWSKTILSSTISCSFPKFGVRSMISKGEDARLRIRCAAHDLTKLQRRPLLRKTMNCSGEAFVCNFHVTQGPFCKKECTVLLFLI